MLSSSCFTCLLLLRITIMFKKCCIGLFFGLCQTIIIWKGTFLVFIVISFRFLVACQVKKVLGRSAKNTNLKKTQTRSSSFYLILMWNIISYLLYFLRILFYSSKRVDYSNFGFHNNNHSVICFIQCLLQYCIFYVI